MMNGLQRSVMSLALTGLSALVATPAAAQATAVTATSAAPSAADLIAPSALGSALKKGGYVIYLRHALTDTTRTDAQSQGDTDCDNQRVLSVAGREMASAIGQSTKALKLRTGDVLSSPLCRTMDTAQLAMGRVTPTNALREIEGRDYAQLRLLLSTPVSPGSNRWLVGHGTPLRLLAGGPPLAEGEAVVLRPGGDRWTVVARLQAADWVRLK